MITCLRDAKDFHVSRNLPLPWQDVPWCWGNFGIFNFRASIMTVRSSFTFIEPAHRRTTTPPLTTCRLAAEYSDGQVLGYDILPGAERLVHGQVSLATVGVHPTPPKTFIIWWFPCFISVFLCATSTVKSTPTRTAAPVPGINRASICTR